MWLVELLPPSKCGVCGGALACVPVSNTAKQARKAKSATPTAGAQGEGIHKRSSCEAELRITIMQQVSNPRALAPGAPFTIAMVEISGHGVAAHGWGTLTPDLAAAKMQQEYRVRMVVHACGSAWAAACARKSCDGRDRDTTLRRSAVREFVAQCTRAQLHGATRFVKAIVQTQVYREDVTEW